MHVLPLFRIFHIGQGLTQQDLCRVIRKTFHVTQLFIHDARASPKPFYLLCRRIKLLAKAFYHLVIFRKLIAHGAENFPNFSRPLLQRQ